MDGIKILTETVVSEYPDIFGDMHVELVEEFVLDTVAVHSYKYFLIADKRDVFECCAFDMGEIMKNKEMFEIVEGPFIPKYIEEEASLIFTENYYKLRDIL